MNSPLCPRYREEKVKRKKGLPSVVGLETTQAEGKRVNFEEGNICDSIVFVFLHLHSVFDSGKGIRKTQQEKKNR